MVHKIGVMIVHGAKLYWPVDNYFNESARQAEFLGHKVTKYHKTLTTYLTSLLTAGFSIERLIEPQLADYLLDKIDGMRDELRHPMMLLVWLLKKHKQSYC